MVFLVFGPGIPQFHPDPRSYSSSAPISSPSCLWDVILLALVTGTRNYDILVPVTLRVILIFFEKRG